MLAVDRDNIVGDNGLQFIDRINECANRVFIVDDGHGPYKRLQSKPLGEFFDCDGGNSVGAAEIPHKYTKRPLPVVAVFRIEPSRPVPWYVWAEDGTQDLPDQIHDLRVVGQAPHPAFHVPIRTIRIIMDDHIGRVGIVVHPRFGQEHVVRRECQ